MELGILYRKKIPWIFITPENKYAHISVDLDTIDDGLIFDDHSFISQLWQKYYEIYRNQRNFPGDKWKFTGSSTHFGIEIWKKDYHQFATKLSHYIGDVIREYAEIDLLLREYTVLIKKQNAMTTGKVPYTIPELEELTEQTIKLRYKIWDKDFNRKTNYEKGRIIKFI